MGLTSDSINRIGSHELIEEGNVEKQFEDKETKIGQKLTETTSKKIIMIVLVIMISIPIFNLDTYVSEFNYFQSVIDTMHSIVSQSDFTLENKVFLENWEYLEAHKDSYNTKLINLNLLFSGEDPDNPQVLKEFSTGASLDNHRKYEHDGRPDQCSARPPSRT